MKKMPSLSSETSELRLRAEARLREQQLEMGQGLNDADAKRLLHELQVHQIELEMQNEELRCAQEELEASCSRYSYFYDLAPVGYLTLSDKDIIIEANLTAATLLGVPRASLVRQPINRFILKEDQDVYHHHRKELVETGTKRVCEFRILKTNDVPFWVQMESSLATNPDGTFVSCVVISDITERKRTEEMLRESDASMMALLNAIAQSVILLDLHGTVLTANKITAQRLGCQLEELLGTCIYSHLPPDMIETRKACLKQVISSGEPLRFEDWRNGRLLDQSLVPICDRSGHVVRVAVFAEDITERKKSEEALQESLKRFRNIVENSSAAYFFIDPKGLYCAVNDTWLRLHKYNSSEEILGRHFSVTQVDADQPRANDAVERLLAGMTVPPGEFTRRCKDGSIGWHTFSINPVRQDGKVVGMEGFLIDTTERKRAEKIYRMLFREMLDGFALHEIICDGQGNPINYRFLAVNPAFERMTGLKAKTLVGRTVIDALPDIERHWIETYGRVALTGEPAIFENYAAALKKHFMVTAFRPVPNQFACIIIDITQRKQAEETLRASERRFQDIADHAQEWIWEVDDKGKYTYSSQVVEKILGYAPEEVLQKHFYDFFHPDDRESFKSAVLAAFSLKQPFRDFINRNLHKNGHTVWLATSGLPMLDASGNLLGYRGVDMDITSRRQAEADKARLEAQFHQAQKMESIGQLAGGVAHDFNNIMAAIMMHMSILMENKNIDQETQESLKELMGEANRAVNLTRQLLMFSRRSVLEMKVLDLNELVANLLKMLGRLIGEHITIQFNRNQNVPAVKADPGMIEQVIMNLAVNARDAMPKSGRLIINIEPIQIDAQRAKDKNQVQPGLFVCLSVTDTGCGMDEATLKRLFEPFFTTKEVGKGTGLGLATVDGIVAQHGGWVDVESKPGKGSTFKVFLPSVKAAVADRTKNANLEIQRGEETILVVEDALSVRRVLAQSLRLMGYRVIEAVNGQEAIKLWKDHDGKIDLLFTDMVMPEGMSGLDLAQKLRKATPKLKVIISSGYSMELVHQGKMAENIVFLPKPYQVEELSKVVRECLDRK